MDCERCESLLLEYVSGELPENDAAEMRAALEVCEHCRHAHEKLERGRALASELPLMDPPPAIFATVMRAAEARALELRAEATAARAPEPAPVERAPVRDEEDGPLEGVWKWLAGLLHGPQFAMAALLVLMVGVGLWWVPALSGPRPIAPPLVSDTPEATAHRGTLVPAEVPHLEIDPRTGRVERENAEEEGRLAEGHAERVAVADEAHVRPVLIAPTDEAEGTEGDGLSAIAALELGTGESIGGRTEDGVLPSMAPSTSPATALAPTTPPPAAAPTPTERVGTSYGASPGSGTAPGGSYGSYGGGSSGLAESDEVPAPTPDDSMIPASLLTQARELVRAGSLLEATRAYERLLSEHPDYGSAPRAMIELAEVFRRRGSISSARRWLIRAEGYASVAPDARRELARLDAMSRAASIDMADDTAEATAAEPAAPASE